MKYMATYDLMESVRNTNEWLGASMQAYASYPLFAMSMNPMLPMMAAWGKVAERSFARMVTKPDWGIRSIVGPDGQDHLVDERIAVERPFGNLVQFFVRRRAPMARRILVVAPMSGHYATLLRSTVTSLLPDADVWVTDWHNARDIPVSAGKFDVEDYTLYIAEFLKELGPDTHVIAVCQPVPLVLAATAWLARQDPAAQPRSLTLMGGPVDPDAAATEVTDFGRRVTMGQLEQMMIQRVGFMHKGAGRLVYPGLLQLAGFISMNGERHTKAFAEQILREARGEASDQDGHNRFYDEYLAVMDMTAEFYLSTVERIFKNREVARNAFTIRGEQVDIGAITSVAVKIVEGENDDISAPGQCLAALDLLTGLPDSKKAHHLEPGAGHYGIFAGKSWRLNIRPLVLRFIDANSAAPEASAAAVKSSAASGTEAKGTGAKPTDDSATEAMAAEAQSSAASTPEVSAAGAQSSKAAATEAMAAEAQPSEASMTEASGTGAQPSEDSATEASAEQPKTAAATRAARGKSRAQIRLASG